MKHFFNSEDRIVNLNMLATSWLGTPWAANGQVRGPGLGCGVACHNLPRALLMECQQLPPTFPQIIGDPNGSHHSKHSVMEPWLDARPEFKKLPRSFPLQAGDLIGIRIRSCLDHLGICLGQMEFIHVLPGKTTEVDKFTDATWSSRLLAAWRPLEPKTSVSGHFDNRSSSHGEPFIPQPLKPFVPAP